MKFFRILLTLSFYLLTPKVHALSLQWAGHGEISHNLKFNKTTVGGLSGLTVADGKVLAVSDDRGQLGKPRFYELLITPGTPWRIEPQKVYEISNIPVVARAPVLDLEGIVSWGTQLIISSEGDNNAKPREMPRLLVTNQEGQWQRDIPLPEKYLPEATGRQTKGIQNNAAFEGVACSHNCQQLFAMTERSLLQDLGVDNEDRSQPVRLITWEQVEGDFKVQRESVYHLDDYATDEFGKEVVRGVSEILPYSENQLLVLERGLNISGRGLSYRAAIYLVDLNGATDVKDLKTLREAKYVALKKKKVFDFSEIQDKLPEAKIQNFEAMIFWSNAKKEKFLLVLSDNNFSKREKTILVALKVNP